ncbi:hypothetical protein [Halorubellus sp. PRR65]|uniref:hypothetical protein n=1 Tax=Halorubellus sp. PRR65 TaxID=3098148 RepID=UPI002B2600D3|nr:hypothetical protein [Halorubellus sp. PRR65]
MYRYTPDEFDKERAHHQAVVQGADDLKVKRIGNLGELAFEQFCREYLPVELWEWKNEESLRHCDPESFSKYDFEVFGYEVDVKTSRDVSAFLPESLLEADPDDDIVVMVWHRDNEDSLILLGWERLETLKSKAESQANFSGEEPDKLDHLAARPMNELLDLGPNTAHMNQKPQNPFKPGDRVVRADDDDPSVGVVIEVLPPEMEAGIYGQTFQGEAVKVAFPSALDAGPGTWREYHPAILASYCSDQDIKRYTYKHSNLEFAPHPYVPGDHVYKTSHDDPNTVLVVETSIDGDAMSVDVVYLGQLEDENVDPEGYLSHCRNSDIKRYTYDATQLDFAESEN